VNSKKGFARFPGANDDPDIIPASPNIHFALNEFFFLFLL
jgi:hypothetical protein